MKLGHTAEAQKLLEESYAVTPSNVTVTAALGEMAAKTGDDAKAMDYLIPARLSGHAPDTANQTFEALYKKSHNGTSGRPGSDAGHGIPQALPQSGPRGGL